MIEFTSMMIVLLIANCLRPEHNIDADTNHYESVLMANNTKCRNDMEKILEREDISQFTMVNGKWFAFYLSSLETLEIIILYEKNTFIKEQFAFYVLFNKFNWHVIVNLKNENLKKPYIEFLEMFSIYYWNIRNSCDEYHVKYSNQILFCEVYDYEFANYVIINQQKNIIFSRLIKKLDEITTILSQVSNKKQSILNDLKKIKKFIDNDRLSIAYYKDKYFPKIFFERMWGLRCSMAFFLEDIYRKYLKFFEENPEKLSIEEMTMKIKEKKNKDIGDLEELKIECGISSMTKDKNKKITLNRKKNLKRLRRL